MYDNNSRVINILIHTQYNPGPTLKADLQRNAMTDMPCPPALLQPHQKKSSTLSIQQDISGLLFQQHRKIKHIIGDGNCFFRALSYFLYGTQDHHLKVRNDIVQFISNHRTHFSALVINPQGEETIEHHIQNMKKPTFWASQVEIQAAADLYGVPLYIYTQTPDKTTYYWLHYTQRMQCPSFIKHRHLELAHPASRHFDCIVDTTTSQPCLIPPRLSGKTSLWKRKF